MMKFVNYKGLLDDLAPYVSTVVMWNYGEPFLNPDVYSMIEYASTLDMRTVCSTNGYPLHSDFPNNIDRLLDSKLDHLIVCLDGASQESHTKYRVGSNFEAIVTGLKELVRRRELKQSGDLNIELQFIVMKHNENEIGTITQLARDIGVDTLSLKTVNLTMVAPPTTLDDVEATKTHFSHMASVYEPTVKVFSRYKDGICGSNAPTHGCARLWEMVVVNWDGTVSPCCYDVNATIKLGNAFETGIREIWNSAEYQMLRAKVLDGRKNVSICSTCSDGTPTGLVTIPISTVRR
jgi:radical SAM protein with 4Fe4S-binding SPASM domain